MGARHFRAISSTIPAVAINLPRWPRLLTPFDWISNALEFTDS